jgi:hypothetical protein
MKCIVLVFPLDELSPVLDVHCFSPVVEPNGSGKSNVIDAMLIVSASQQNRVCFLILNVDVKCILLRSTNTTDKIISEISGQYSVFSLSSHFMFGT